MRESIAKYGHTKTPNAVLDIVLPTISPPAQLIFLKIIRQTIGWNERNEDKISYSQFQKATGYRERKTISRALKELKEKELIIADGSGTHIRTYRVNWLTVDLYLQKWKSE